MARTVEKSTDLVVSGAWNAPYLSGVFADSVMGMAKACTDTVNGRLDAQFFFSHIIKTGEWEDAREWFDLDTGEVFASQDDIPQSSTNTCSYRNRFSSQDAFLSWCELHIHGFKRNTFYIRHSIIDKFCEIGHDFVESVRLVAGEGGIWRNAIELQKVFTFNPDRTVSGFDSNLAKNLPGIPDNLSDMEEDAQLEAVKDASQKYSREIVKGIEAGSISPKTATHMIRKDIFREPVIDAFIPSNYFPYAIRMNVRNSENKFSLDDQVVVYVKFFDADDNVVELGPEMKTWVSSKLRVG